MNNGIFTIYQLVISEPSTEEKRVKSLNICKKEPLKFKMVSPEKCTYSRRKGDSKLGNYHHFQVKHVKLLGSTIYSQSLIPPNMANSNDLGAPCITAPLGMTSLTHLVAPSRQGLPTKKEGPPLPWHGTAFSEVNSDQFHIISKYGTL